jgi:hypothetical protein
MDLDESTIAEAFQSAGYATAAFGKWHNGMQAPYHPNSRGFDEYYGFCSGHWGHYFDPVLEHNGELVRGKGFVVDDFTDHAISFIEDHRDRPFFVYLPYNTPHSPMQVPDKNWAKFDGLEIDAPASHLKKQRFDLQHTQAALAMCENIDDNVGRVLKKLDQLDLADNTIVVYFCDNGPNGWRFNAGQKGRKGSTDEGGVHSPLFVRWPEKIQAGSKLNMVTGAIDLFPTLVGLCEIDAKPKKPWDGISFALDLKGAKVKRSSRELINYWNRKLSVRSQRYRLDNRGVLFDIENDRGQRKPVTDRPEVLERLTQAAEAWSRDVLVELDRETVRLFPIGHRSLDNTQLPARDAKASGKIKRSNRFPNCSYLLNWVDVNDSITWPVDVLEGGKFQVEVHYCCAEENLGATLELSLGDRKVSATVETANVSPLIGAEQDRSVRGESLVKNFKPLSMGVIELEPGQGELILRSTEIPGSESIEFRLLMLKRVDSTPENRVLNQ